MKPGPLRVIVVEDEAVLAMDLEAMVEDSGHLKVADGASLPDVAAIPTDAAPDLVFVDMQLAEKSTGLGVCEHVKERWPNAVIVFVTANPNKVPEDFAGAHGLIAKPFSRSGFLRVMAFLSEALLDPPPKAPTPASFTLAPRFERRWSNPPTEL